MTAKIREPTESNAVLNDCQLSRGLVTGLQQVPVHSLRGLCHRQQMLAMPTASCLPGVLTVQFIKQLGGLLVAECRAAC